jgi:hypothetical protein
MHRHGSVRDVAELDGRGVLGITPADRCLSVAKLFFAYGLGNSAFLPLAAGASAVLERARPTPPSIAPVDRLARRGAAAGPVLRGADVLLEPAGLRRARRQLRLGASGRLGRRAATGHVAVPVPAAVLCGAARPARLDRGTAHLRVSNRPNRARAGSPGGPVAGYRVELRPRSRAVRDICSSVDRRSRPGTGVGPRPPAGCSRGSGCEPGTPPCATRTGRSPASGAPTTCSRSEVSGSPRPRSRSGCGRHPDVAQVAVVAGQDADGLDKPVACVVPATAGCRPGGARHVVSRRAGCPQAPAGRDPVHRTAEDGDRQDPPQRPA